MNLFQAVFAPLCGLLALYSIGKLAKGHRPRWQPFLSSCIWLAATIAILKPELTSELAQLMGIGRGADLLVYIVALSSILGILFLNQRYRRLESELTSLVRRLALQDARGVSNESQSTLAQGASPEGQGD